MRATKLHQAAALCVGLSLPLAIPHAANASVAPLAHATLAPSVEELEAKAVEAYEAGEFLEAAEHFKAAHETSGDPNFLYNVGRVYEEAGDLEQAIEYYDRFIHAEGVGLDTRMVASERLSQLKKITGQTDEEETDTTQPDGTAESVPPESATTDDPPRDDGKDPDKRLMITGAVLIGVGAPAALAGAVLGGVALRNNDRLESEQLDDPLKAQKNGRNQALAADILIPVGSALAVTGIALLIVNAVRKSRKSSRTALAPSVTRTQAGVSLVGRF